MNRYISELIIVLIGSFFACESKRNNSDKSAKISDDIYTISDIKGHWKYILYNTGWNTKSVKKNEYLIIREDSLYQYFVNDELIREGKIKFDHPIQYDEFKGTTLKFDNWNYDFRPYITNRKNEIYLILSDGNCWDCESFSFLKIENKDRR